MTVSQARYLARHDAEQRRAAFLRWVEARLRELTKENLTKYNTK